MGSFPDWIVPFWKVAWTSDALSPAPDYDDISVDGSRFETVEIHRGRNPDSEQYEAGTMNFRAQNDDQRFQAFRAASPYFPNVLPRRRNQFGFWYGGTPYPLFTGWTRKIGEGQDEFGWNAKAILPSTDGFLALSKARLNADLETEEPSGTRIVRILDLVGWPGTGLLVSPGHRAIDAGNNSVQPQELRDTSALEAIYHVELTEHGRFFIAADGTATFLERAAFFSRAPYDTSQGVFGDDPDSDEIPYQGIVIELDDERIHNHVTGNRAGGPTLEVEDSESIAKYFRNTLPVSELLLPTDNDVLDYIYYRLFRESQPSVAISPITIQPLTRPADYLPLALTDVLCHRFTVRIRNPRDTSELREVEINIESLHHTIDFTAGTWDLEIQLSAADPNSPYWILEDAVYGVADDTTVWAF